MKRRNEKVFLQGLELKELFVPQQVTEIVRPNYGASIIKLQIPNGLNALIDMEITPEKLNNKYNVFGEIHSSMEETGYIDTLPKLLDQVIDTCGNDYAIKNQENILQEYCIRSGLEHGNDTDTPANIIAARFNKSVHKILRHKLRTTARDLANLIVERYIDKTIVVFDKYYGIKVLPQKFSNLCTQGSTRITRILVRFVESILMINSEDDKSGSINDMLMSLDISYSIAAVIGSIYDVFDDNATNNNYHEDEIDTYILSDFRSYYNSMMDQAISVLSSSYSDILRFYLVALAQYNITNATQAHFIHPNALPAIDTAENYCKINTSIKGNRGPRYHDYDDYDDGDF